MPLQQHGIAMLKKAFIVAGAAIGSGVIAGVVYRTAMTMPLPESWSVAQFEWAGLIAATAFGITAGAVTRHPMAVGVGAAFGLLAAAAEVETHTDVVVGTLLAIELALEYQSRLVFVLVLVISAGAFVGAWFRGRVNIHNAPLS